MNDDGTQNIDIVNNVISEINKFDSNLLIVLKSTILPKYVEEISKVCRNLVINPEFLRENYAEEDFINSEIIILGGEENNCKKLSYFYKIILVVFVKNMSLLIINQHHLLNIRLTHFLHLKLYFSMK